MRNDEPILVAQFDPKVKTYWYFQGVVAHFSLVFAFIGLFTLPLWVVFGWMVVSRRYDHLKVSLLPRAVHTSSGVWTRVEKTIPLDKIVDLSLRTGPLLDAFGLASIQIETAGGSAQGGADMTLQGVVKAKDFRDAVLAQRDKITDHASGAPAQDATEAVLVEIRDTLKRIEAHLTQR